MENQISLKLNRIRLLANNDDEYYHMIKVLRDLEAKYQMVLENLSPDGQDIVCDFVSKCEEISWKLLEIACCHMEFADFQE